MAAILLQLFFLLLLLVFIVFFTAQFFNIIFRGFAPFISTRPDVIERIMSELKPDETAVVYELGCGKAGFLRALRRRYPKIKLIGIEYSFLPYLIAQIQNSLTGAKIILRKQNIFQADLGEADIIYCYLNPLTMQKLETKFKQECKTGAQVVSYQFPLPSIATGKTVELGEHERIYFYKLG
ncbi:MAG: class I SAM-dependent methyltransferase [Planctomycetes bacterium]|jgi:hypothetical protein|nr:class I SAM-dependent methyltransferase [Planctomycetota bacterium]